MQAAIIVICVLSAIALILLALSVKVVQQSTAIVVERLGKYHKTLHTGIHMILPFFDRVVTVLMDMGLPTKKISLKERVADFKPQGVITKDNVTMLINTVVYLQVTDVKLYAYGV